MNRREVFYWYKTESPLNRVVAYLRSWILPLEAVLEVVPQCEAILDIACGHGLMLHGLARSQKPITQIHGIDLDAKRLETAKRSLREFPNVKLFYGDALEWQPPLNYGCVILSDVLHHLKPNQKSELIKKAKSWLKPRGTLIVKDVDWHPRWKGWVSVFHDALISGIKACVEPRVRIENILKESGFVVSDAKRIDRFQPYAHYLIVSRKD